MAVKILYSTFFIPLLLRFLKDTIQKNAQLCVCVCVCVCVLACILATNKEASPIVKIGGHNMIISSLGEIEVENLIVSTDA